MKSFLAVSLFTLSLSFSSAAQDHSRPPSTPSGTPSSTPRTMPNNAAAPGWVRFTSEPGRFSVLMPEIPTDKTETVPSEHGPYTTHLFIVRDVKSLFLIGWVDYDPSFNFNRQSELEANRDNFVKGLKATLLSSRALTIDGYQALEFTAETTDRIFRSRVYMVGRRPYQIVAGSLKGQDDSVNVSRFFESFKVRLP